MSTLILRAHYTRRDTTALAEEPIDWYGTFTLDLEIGDASDFPPGSRLAVWCSRRLEVGAETNARVIDRISGHVELEPLDHRTIVERGRWAIDGLHSTLPARHANDGPESAYVILADGSTSVVHVVPATTADRPRSSERVPQAATASDTAPPLVPVPRNVEVTVAGDRPAALRLAAASAAHRAIWDAAAALASRLGTHAFDTTATGGVEVPTAAMSRTAEVHLDVDPSLGAESYGAVIADGRVRVTGGDADGLRRGLVTVAQWATSGLPAMATIDDSPTLPARVVHLDLARRWYEPDVVGRLIDLAAWRKLNRVHLHLTDDEGWRFPVPGYPALSAIGGTRGHGLPIGALVGSGPAPYGRAYTSDEIAAWVCRAADLGITLVPEVDVPGHCFAAFAAVPELRDGADTSGARSVQGFVDNVLVPGHPATMPFLEAVFRSLAELFPTSPWLHIGGDEVPHGAWSGSPLARAYADERGLSGTREIEASFHRDVIEMIRATTGRDVAMWEEAALAGIEPAGYAVAWTSAAAGRRLVEAGHDVVMAPGQAYYLDMAPDREWSTPGATWAGTTPFETTCDFDPFGAVPAAGPGRIVGVQACIWSEHIASIEILDRLVFPRLDAVAERGWRGEIVGGSASLADRAAPLPRFVP